MANISRGVSSKAALLALLMITPASGCLFDREGPELYLDSELSHALREINEDGGSRPLSDLAPGKWDTVHVFADPVSRDHVEETVGQPVDMGDIFITRGNILVFMDGESVFRAVVTEPGYLFPGTYSAAVRVVDSFESGSPKLDLVEPESPDSHS